MQLTKESLSVGIRPMNHQNESLYYAPSRAVTKGPHRSLKVITGHQTTHLCPGFTGAPLGQEKAAAKAAELETVP